ncbi:MAG: hypothetical protein WC184_10960 [Acidimicrobiia bacterium]
MSSLPFRHSNKAPKPAPPSVRVRKEVPWEDPDAVRPTWLQRGASGVMLLILVVILGIMLTVAIGILLIMAFFLADYIIG